MEKKNASFIIDFTVHGGGYADEATRKVFSETTRLQRWLDIEIALMSAQSDLGLIPQKAVKEAKSKAKIENFNLNELQESTRVTKHSLMPLLVALEKMCSPETAAHLHRGATTQDIQDTALALEIKDVLTLVKARCAEVLEKIKFLMHKHSETLATGRTHSMPASPITFGLKLAGWADELMRTVERIEQAESRLYVVQLFGSVGSMASFEGQGQELIRKFAKKLDLQAPDTSWHASRDRVAEFVYLLAMVSSSLARFADELRTLNRVELREVVMGFQKGEIGSSCMPHKRNPEDAEQIVVLARLTRAQLAPMIEGMIVEHERDYRGTRMEWPCVMQASHYTYNALVIFSGLLSNLFVNEERMEENAQQLSQFLFVEHLLGYLTRKIGRAEAFDIVYELTQISQDAHEDIKSRALSSKRLANHIDKEKLQNLFDIQQFVGESKSIIDSVAKKIEGFNSKRTHLKVAS